MTRILRMLTLAAAGAALLSACGTGYDRLLFVTKSNVGVDFDSQPPAAAVSIGRKEGVVEPTFEGGKTLPVMSSFRPENKGITSGNVGQTFATGDAAVAMATLYNAPDIAWDPLTGDWDQDVRGRFDSTLALDGQAVFPDNAARPPHNEVRPVFFGTTTSFGVAAQWSGMTATMPDSFHLGFRRKELALAPVNYRDGYRRDASGNVVRGADGAPLLATTVGTPSLLATIDVASSTTSPTESRIEWLQYFATGRAATALALRRDVRAAMLKRMDPAQAGAFAAGGGLTKVAVVSLIYGTLDERREQGDTQSGFHASRLDALASEVPATYPFNAYTEDGSGTGTGIEVDPNKKEGDPVQAADKPYNKLSAYWSDIKGTMGFLEAHIPMADGAATVDGEPLDGPKREKLMADLKKAGAARARFEGALQRKSDVVADAVAYYMSLPE